MQSIRLPAYSLIGLGALLLATTGLAQNPSIRIMPLGDSITYGAAVPSDIPGGYRDPLYAMLTNAGYTVDYVGTVTGNGSPTLPDSDQEGHPGWTIDGLRGSILDWFTAITDPHVILVHIGTNDSGYGDFANAVNRLDALVTTLATCQPSAHIIVTSLMKRNGDAYTAITNYFNPFVPGKVDAQAALGRRVTFLDMNAYVELSDMGDGLHPNAAGYAKMAAAWFTAITNVVQPEAVTPNRPALIRATAGANRLQAQITFNKKVSPASATNPLNYAVDNGVEVTGAALSADQRTVTLATSLQAAGTTYTVTVNNVADETPLSVPADSQVTFSVATPRGYMNNVPESPAYTLVYSVDLPSRADYLNKPVGYSVDNSQIVGPFSRVAYYLELQSPGGDVKYLWASMSAFAERADKLGVPTIATETTYQKNVSNLNVFCNVAGVVTGTGLSGNLEFWPSDYGTQNLATIPNADSSAFDFGDFPSPGKHGSMQLHNFDARQTLFALNNWGGNYDNDLSIGIGNNPSGHPDWTGNFNAGGYTVKMLQVLVLRNPPSDTTPPAVVSAQAGAAGTLVTLVFTEPLTADSVDGLRFALNNGVQVLSAALLSDLRTVNLITTPQPAGASLTLTLGGIRDLAANAVPAGTAVAVAAAALPASLAANAGPMADGYKVVYAFDIPVTGNFNSSTAACRYNQSGLIGTFDRVAYYAELVKPNGVTQYLWVAMNPFTDNKAKLGVPTLASGAVFQQVVTNLDVKSNVSGVQNGAGMTGGNIEFWPHNYDPANGLGLAGANGGAYDFDDTLSMAVDHHGCMQIHNSGAAQTLFAMNHWGDDGYTLAVGIGNSPSGAPDWTGADNTASYVSRTLYVLVRPTPNGLPPEIGANVGALTNGFTRIYSLDIPVTGTFNTSPNPYICNLSNPAEAFDRIAYYAELVKPSGETQYLWAAMDPFTGDETRIGIPTLASGSIFQQAINNLEVASNVSGVQNGTFASGGNIEFWPFNYTTANGLGLAGAVDGLYDFDDVVSYGGHHGCMQIHNSGAAQTLFAMNNWGDDGNPLAVGIGSQPSGYPDWTSANNAGSYARRTLHILVRPTTPPTADPLQAPAEVTAIVPEASNYQLAYIIDLPVYGHFDTDPSACYTVNNVANGLATSFSRIAYFLALQPVSGPAQYVWAAMDAFTSEAGRLGVPTGNTYFQQRVSRLDVKSNVGSIVTGSNIDTGNIEFWPYNYGPNNALGIPNASSDAYDFGDVCNFNLNHGCMQVHNYGERQTLFAVNNFNFNESNPLAIGIGNCPSGNPDWTGAVNAGSYTYRRLYVFVLPGGDTSDLTRPTLNQALASTTLNQVFITFSETVADNAATAAFYTLNNGASVTGAQLLSNKKEMILTTTALTAGQTYLLAVTGVRDRSANGNLIAPGSSASFTAPAATLPSVLSNVPEASAYALIYQLAVPDAAHFVPAGAPYTVDESRFPRAHAFDRVAYCLELAAPGGATNWVYVSMDAFTGDLNKIGVPTAERGAAFKAFVNNMNVYSAAGANVVTGTGIATGNIEFWPSNYGTGNGAGISGADGSKFDFDDSGFGTAVGHGSMQVHNFGAGETILSLSQFGYDNSVPSVGIGNNTDFSKNPGWPYPDWTFSGNAPSYSVKNIYVLAHWGATPEGTLTGTRPDIWDQPQSLKILSGRSALISIFAPYATTYQWRKNGEWIPGANLPWLEISPAEVSDRGVYDVLAYGSGTAYTVSQSATLTVFPLGTVLRLR